MKVTYNWLKEFIDLKIPPEELARRLTMAGLEVVSLKEEENDFVFEIEITSNRPDWLSVYGIAREVGAICPGKLKKRPKPALNFKKGPGDTRIKISVNDKKDCPFYSALVISGVSVTDSPPWLKNRLERLGCRSVNNVVDITNYILFQSGQPLHAFDLDKLAGPEIFVRRAKNGEKIITIDQQEKSLDPEVLLIADRQRPLALAGIMGGKSSEVTASTRNILIESAVFNPLLLRWGRRKLGLQSESAYRFERGVSFTQAVQAPFEAAALILKLAGGKITGYQANTKPAAENRFINLDISGIPGILGVELPLIKIKQILSKLGLEVKTKTKNFLTVKIPDFRPDLKIPVDLIEEIARIYGYEKIPTTFPRTMPGARIVRQRKINGIIKNTLAALGAHEVITYSLIDRCLIEKMEFPAENLIEIQNPLSSEQGVLRPTLLPSLACCLAHNLNQQQELVKIFEIADIFYKKEDEVNEEPVLGIALCGSESFLTNIGMVKDEINLLHLKGLLTRLFESLKIRDFDFVSENRKIDILLGKDKAGFMFNLSGRALSDFNIKNRQVVLAEINLETLSAHIIEEKKFANIPKYPPIIRDISFITKKETDIKGLLKAVKEKGLPFLNSVEIIDYYQGKQIPQGFTGLTISCVYRLNERTLTEEEILPVHNAICVLLEKELGSKLR